MIRQGIIGFWINRSRSAAPGQARSALAYSRFWRFYRDGFRSMTLGRTLWAVILIKLFIMFFILKLFFFPPFLKGKSTEEKEDYVGNELIERAIHP